MKNIDAGQPAALQPSAAGVAAAPPEQSLAGGAPAAQKACKVTHLDTAIAGTAAACNGMQSEFCFSIHCLHAAGMADPTGTVYCK